MKKITFIFALLLCANLFSPYANAAMALPAQETEPMEIGEDVQPRYSYTSIVVAYLGKDSSGKASCTAAVRGKSTATKVVGNMYLEQYKNGRWIQYNKWDGSADSGTLNMDESFSVDAGYTYRVRFSGTVYSGSKSESVSATSSTLEF